MWEYNNIRLNPFLKIVYLNDNKIHLTEKSTNKNLLSVTDKSSNKRLLKLIHAIDKECVFQDELIELYEGLPMKSKNVVKQLVDQHIFIEAKESNYVQALQALPSYELNPNKKIVVLGIGPLGYRIAFTLLQMGVQNMVVVDDAPVTNIDIQMGTGIQKKHLSKLKGLAFIESVEERVIDGTPVVQWECEKELERVLDKNIFVVVVSENLSSHHLSNIKQLSSNIGFSWMLISSNKEEFIIGPTFIPNDTLCLSCLEMQIDLSDCFDNPFYPLYGIVTELAAIEILNTISGNSRTIGNIIEINPITLTIKNRDVYKLPSCNFCIQK